MSWYIPQNLVLDIKGVIYTIPDNIETSWVDCYYTKEHKKYCTVLIQGERMIYREAETFARRACCVVEVVIG